jgi:hypothetical protein
MTMTATADRNPATLPRNGKRTGKPAPCNPCNNPAPLNPNSPRAQLAPLTDTACLPYLPTAQLSPGDLADGFYPPEASAPLTGSQLADAFGVGVTAVAPTPVSRKPVNRPSPDALASLQAALQSAGMAHVNASHRHGRSYAQHAATTGLTAADKGLTPKRQALLAFLAMHTVATAADAKAIGVGAAILGAMRAAGQLAYCAVTKTYSLTTEGRALVPQAPASQVA